MFRYDLYTHLGAGAYICGEETASPWNPLRAKKASQDLSHLFQPMLALFGKPTTINNTETFASVPEIPSQGVGNGLPI